MSKNKTSLNKKYRFPITINSRLDNFGAFIPYVNEVNEYGMPTKNIRVIDQCTENGGEMTPFNIQCSAIGAPAIRKIIVNGDETTVLFADGDKVVLKRHDGDKEDLVTAVLWALGKKVFGVNLARQIHTAINCRTIDAKAIHAAKAAEKLEKTK